MKLVYSRCAAFVLNPAAGALLAYHNSPPPLVLLSRDRSSYRSSLQVERKSDGKIYALKRVNISKMSKREVKMT